MKERDDLHKSNSAVRKLLMKDSETAKVEQLKEEMLELKAKKKKSEREWSRFWSLLKYFKIA